MQITIGWPQGIMILLILLGEVSSAVQHGKPRDPLNYWYRLVGDIILIGLLIWGGFFK